jgi:hypothetical protein
MIKVKMLLEDRKIQKQTIDAQKEELATMRTALNSSKDAGNSSLETVVVQSELGEARRELVTARRRVDQLVADSQVTMMVFSFFLFLVIYFLDF